MVFRIPRLLPEPRALQGASIYIYKTYREAHTLLSPRYGGVRHGKKLWFPIYMQSERRDLEYFGKGLTDEQVVEKKRMLKESA